MHLIDGKGKLYSTGVPAKFDVALDVPDMTRVPVDRLLRYSVGKHLERLNEAFLCCRCSGADGIQPEPTNVKNEGVHNVAETTYDRVTSPPTHSPSGRSL